MDVSKDDEQIDRLYGLVDRIDIYSRACPDARTNTPPQGEPLLRELLANWECFLNETGELDPLVKMAIGHYQFEAIHPFSDGNGRTGRVLNSLYLVSQGLIGQPVLYLSRAIIEDKDRYYRLLHGVTAADAWEPWIAKRQTAATYARSLVTAGVLEERAAGQAKVFVNTRLMRLLTQDSNEAATAEW